MKHVIPTATFAGARSPRARTPDAPAFPPVARRALLPAVRTIRHELGLSTGDLLVLDALLSFLPCRDRRSGEERPIASDLVLVIFASNAALCERANGMEERVLRRHVSRLCEAGLLRRKDSATGKRFPLKADGLIRDAFGLDLTPLLERHPELTRRAEETRRRGEELRSVRAEALALRARALALGERVGEEAARYLDSVKTILRRATLTLDQVRDVMGRINALLTGAPCPACPRANPAGSDPTSSADLRAASDPCTPSTGPAEPDDTARETSPETSAARAPRPGAAQPRPSAPTPKRTRVDAQLRTGKESGEDGRNVRQEESPQIEDKKTGAPVSARSVWISCKELASFYPDPPGSEMDLIRIIYEFGKMMNITDRPLAGALNRMGPIRMMQALDYLAKNVARINRPEAYLDRMISDLEAGRPVGWAR